MNKYSTPGKYSHWRREALDALNRIESGGAFISRISRGVDSDKRGAGRTMDVVGGVTRQRRWLDFLIESFARHPSRIDQRVRQILRMGLYEMLFMDLPHYAVIDEAVGLVKAEVRPQAGSFVNAILRNIQRQLPTLPQPEDPDPAVELAIRYSHPDWMVKRWRDRFDKADVRALLEHNNRRPRYTLRCNTLESSMPELRKTLETLDVPCKDSPVVDDGVVVESLEKVLKSEAFDQGQVLVQDTAAMCVVRWLDPRPGERILDLCAAPGGKTIYAAQRMRDDGEIVASDVHAARLRLVQKAASKHGLSIIDTRKTDARKLTAEKPFDAILIDAPCTGTGVLAKRADLRWNRKEEDLARLCVLQKEILDHATTLLAPGGRIVYATCSIETEENQEQAKAFLERHSDFVTETPDVGMKSEIVGSNGWLEILPHWFGTDGAFAARLVKK